jgi:hypothetical protein
MAEAVGLAASIIAVLTVAAQVSVLTSQFLNSMKGRKEKVLRLRNSVIGISTTLEKARILTIDLKDNPKLVSSLLEWNENGLLKDCHHLLAELQKKLDNAVTRKMAIFIWPIVEKEMDAYMDSLETYKTSFISAMTVELLYEFGLCAASGVLNYQLILIYRCIQGFAV